MDSFVGYLFLLSVLCQSFFGVEGQSQSWNTKHVETQDQDGGSEQQHWASGRAGNGGQQFMSMSSLYEKMETVLEVDDLFIDDRATIITDSFVTEAAQPAPDDAKAFLIENAVDEIDAARHQTWASSAIDNVFSSQNDLGLGVSYPVLLPMMVPVRFLSDKDIDINIEQIYSPPPTDEDSINDGGSKMHQNTEKLHIHLGPKASTIPAGNIKYTKNAAYFGDEGFLFTGKLTLKRKTLCKILCLRGDGNVPACCTCNDGGGRKRDVMQEKAQNEQGERALNNVNWFSEPNECYFLDSSYLSGADVTDADCTYCKCLNGDIACFVRKTCKSLREEQHVFEAELDEIRQLVIEKGSSEKATTKFKKLKSSLATLQEEAKNKHNDIIENLKLIFKDSRHGTPSEDKHTFLSLYQEQDDQAKMFNYKKNRLLQSIINEIKRTT